MIPHSSRSQFQELQQQRGNRSLSNGVHHGAPQNGSPRRGRSTSASPARLARASGGKYSDNSRSFGVMLREFYKLLDNQKGTIAVSLAVLSVATLLKLVPPIATKLAIDYSLDGKPVPALWQSRLALPDDRFQLLVLLAVAVMVTTLISLALHVYSRWLSTKAVQRVQVSVRKRVYEHALRLPLQRIFSLKAGGGASLVRHDAGGVGELVFSMLYNPWQAVMQLLGILAALLWVDWRLCLAGLALAPMVYFSHRGWIARIRPLYREIRAQRQHVDALATETFSGIRVVRSFGRTDSEVNRYTLANHVLVRQELNAWWWSRTVDVFWGIVLPLATMSLLLYGGSQVLQGNLTTGDLMMLLGYLAMLLGPLAVLANSAASFQTTLAGLDRVLDLLDEDSAPDATPTGKRIARSQTAGSVALEGVSFRYPGSDQWTLTDIDLELRAGETVAIVGRSGAGKTTLSNLVGRFYDPTEGRVSLDGRDLRELNPEDYRRQLAIVGQEVFLFDGTIAENIGYARRHASREEIQRVARAARADRFIESFEHGYDTLVGERGVRLSGGERQRIAIARALLVDPLILILDEATSNIDSESEQLIQQALAKLTEERTTLVIAHRISSLVHADRVAVLEAGRIVDIGPHLELIERNAYYREMVDMQSTMPEAI